jgi:inorganic triphosphatase YgiF
MAPVIEVELKLRADDDGPLDWLAAAEEIGPATLGPLREVDELDRYLDTADRRLAGARWACRLRSRGGEPWVSLKGPARHEPGDALHRRPELEGPATGSLDPADWPASPARERLMELSSGRPLAERLALRQRRGERAVLLAGSPVATLSLDRVLVERGDMPHGRLLAVELEWHVPRGEDAAAIEEVLLATPGLRPEPSSKLELALAMLDAG